MLSCHVPEYFHNRDLRLILFGGKGGVGKTTMAASAALHLAQSNPDEKKVLIVSTDPAHSLSDSFGIEIGDRVTPVSVVSGQGSGVSDEWSVVSGRSAISNPQSAISNLYAREMDASRLAGEFKAKNEAVIKKLADRGTYFDQQDIAEIFDLSLPGMDEVMAIIEMANLIQDGTYDILIVDTAPTGHTVRMLNLPAQMQKWIEVMDLMQHKHRYMFVHFTGKSYVKDECDIFLDNLSSDIDRVKRLLSNIETTRFVPVTIPEPMSVYETERMLISLEKINVPVKEIIVNRVMESEDCEFCRLKKEDQKKPLAEIKDKFSRYNLIKVPLFPVEIRGVAELKKLTDYLSGKASPIEFKKANPQDEEHGAYLNLDPDLEFVLFGGKGGVGKTTLASAAALYIAGKYPGKRILIFSTDPAHSLSDSFGIEIGDNVTPIPLRAVGSEQGAVVGGQLSVYSDQWSGEAAKAMKRIPNSELMGKHSAIRIPQSALHTNLFGLEMNADKLFEDFKKNFRDEIEDVFDRFLGSRVDIKFDREVMTELFTLAPPGLDEIMAIDTIMDMRKEKKFDLFILDTSPTGHLLRFLELPDMVREWLRAFFRLLLKYKGVVRLAKAAENALSMSRNVRRIQETLTDPEKTDFIGVTIPEAMGVLELERLIDALDDSGISCNNIAINMVIPQMDCGFCSLKREEQQRHIKKIRSSYPDRTIIKIPLFSHEIRGVDSLSKIGKTMFF
ncbi:MAG: ArsA family ATPase [Syntrophales bacterium]|nr:ArsA family ATPase [Syntrophales bacterium]